jgi:hypothetical protein
MRRPPSARTLVASVKADPEGARMNIHVTRLRAACSLSLVLVALGALPATAAALGPNTHESSAQQCPCNIAGGPPGGLPSLLAAQAAVRPGAAAALVRVQVTPVAAAQPGTTFDWSAAAVGAAVAIAVGLLGVGLASGLRRHRVRVHARA